MPVIISPVDAYPASFTTFADGDAVSQANFVQNMQEFADALTYLRNRTVPAGSLVISAALGGPGGTAGGTFTYDAALALWSGPSPAPALPASITWGLDLGAVLPAGGPFQVSEIEAWTISTTTHGGLDPATPQGIRLDYRDPASGSTALQNVVIQLDPSPAATLDTLHSFSASGLGHSIVPGASYSIRWICESGANAQPTDIHAFNITIEAV
jgi:hypothetical protein